MFGITVVWQSYTAGGDVLKLAFDTQVRHLGAEPAPCSHHVYWEVNADGLRFPPAASCGAAVWQTCLLRSSGGTLYICCADPASPTQEQAEEWRTAFADAISRQTARKPRQAGLL